MGTDVKRQYKIIRPDFRFLENNSPSDLQDVFYGLGYCYESCIDCSPDIRLFYGNGIAGEVSRVRKPQNDRDLQIQIFVTDPMIDEQNGAISELLRKLDERFS